ncbi:hypothetical protein K469DRAFT_554788 [Zopfia rhizophila CBS 207.26]|uniref:Uncharacterized protein n=1 Tax=Zopfia rhizophila CBS 207.26 TaxID=1314779 RepID=A0A6A6ENV6_9PEZI|nr:hypothetical protein K469DRAFT_554788 [Zopfia rhizophila CBS 207.26]
MCWCFPFGLSNTKKRKSTSSGEKKRRERPATDPLHGTGVAVVTEVQEKRRSKGSPQKRKSRETVTPRSPRREREEYRPRQEYRYRNEYRSREQYRPALDVQVPNMWYRSVEPESTNSSQEMLLNPRPHRSPHHRQRHPKRTSQTTLRGRGAKRDPPRHSKSKKSLRQESPRLGWSFFAPPPPKTPSRRERHYQTFDSSPRSHRLPRHHHSTYQYQEIPESSQSQHRHRSRQHQRLPPSTRQARSRTPNTAARRTPDRRFAVLAATNQALEELRREAFAHPSPPPRRERVQRYQGVAIPTSSIPFNWDCVSSSQTSAGYGESSTRPRRGRR